MFAKLSKKCKIDKLYFRTPEQRNFFQKEKVCKFLKKALSKLNTSYLQEKLLTKLAERATVITYKKGDESKKL